MCACSAITGGACCPSVRGNRSQCSSVLTLFTNASKELSNQCKCCSRMQRTMNVVFYGCGIGKSLSVGYDASWGNIHHIPGFPQRVMTSGRAAQYRLVT